MRAERVAFGFRAGTKWCPGHRTVLPVSDFGANSSKVDGLAVRCRACRAEDARQRRKRGPEAVPAS
jgi:hypothetical protein